jgi:hypothetical protein
MLGALGVAADGALGSATLGALRTATFVLVALGLATFGALRASTLFLWRGLVGAPGDWDQVPLLAVLVKGTLSAVGWSLCWLLFWEIVGCYVCIAATHRAFPSGLLLHAHFFVSFGMIVMGEVWPSLSVLLETDWVEEISVQFSSW